MICGRCGNPERDSINEPDENGNCGVCGADNWVEWGDFKTEDLRDYVDEAANHLNISKSKLIRLVYESIQKSEHISFESILKNKRDAIHQIFEEFKL